MTPVGSISPFGTLTSTPAGHKVVVTGSKNIGSESLGVTLSAATPVFSRVLFCLNPSDLWGFFPHSWDSQVW